MDKLFAILAVFRKGNALADSALWKNGGMAAAGFAALLVAVDRLLALFGHPLGITETDAQALGVGAAALGHILLAAATSKTVGLPSASGVEPAGSANPTGDTKPAEAPEPPRVTNL